MCYSEARKKGGISVRDGSMQEPLTSHPRISQILIRRIQYKQQNRIENHLARQIANKN